MLAGLVILVLSKFKIWKDVVIHILTMGFMMLIDNCGLDVKKMVRIALAAVFFVSFFMCNSLADTFSCIKDDILWNYTSGMEMAEYINSKLPDEDMILVDGSTYIKSI